MSYDMVHTELKRTILVLCNPIPVKSILRLAGGRVVMYDYCRLAFNTDYK